MSEVELDSLGKALEADLNGFRSFADALPNFIWLTGADGRAQFLNAQLLAYAGHQSTQTLERGFISLLYPDDAGRAVERWNDSLATGTPLDVEYRLRRASDGTYRWFLARSIPIRDSAGNVAYWIGTATDIDAQKRAVENLNFVMEASGVFAAAATVNEVCGEFARLAVQHFADWCFVMLRDPGRHFKIPAIAHRDPQRVRYIEKYVEQYPLRENPSLEQMLAQEQPTLIPRISDELLQKSAHDAAHLQVMRDLQLYSAIVAPLRDGVDALGAVIMYSAESRREFNGTDADVLKLIAQRAAERIHTMRTLTQEQHARRRLQFIGRATQAVYESFDLTSAFGNLSQIIVSQIGDMAAVFRLEDGNAARVVAAAHRDSVSDDIARSMVGIRVMHGAAEKRFVRALEKRKPLVGRDVDRGSLEGSVWPYLSEEIAALAPVSLVTVPLHSRGKVHGAIVVYYTQNGRPFGDEDVELLVEIGRHASVALENADIFERERRMSETLQDSLLPPSLPQVEGLSFDAVYLPSATEAQVGGDWYDAFQLEDGTTVVTAGDVTGRGADAAVIMGKVRHLIAIAPCYERDPARILDTVESVLARRYPDAIVTAFLGFIQPDRATMVYANAGHPPPLMRIAAGALKELSAEGLPLGLRREAPHAGSRTADLRDARMIVLYTDGLTEAGRDVLEGNRRLREVIARDAVLHTHQPAHFIQESCLGEAAPDDVAVLTISFESGVRWSFDAENAKAAQDARGEFVRYLHRHAGEEDGIVTAELVFGELVGNVVRHASGAIDIDVEWTDGSLMLHVLDRGPAFEAPSHLPDDVLSESGRGLFIIRNLSTSLRVEHVPGYGNHVCVELPIRRASPSQRAYVKDRE